MTEAQITTIFRHYLTEHPPRVTLSYELKLINLEKTKSFAFDRVAPHQIEGLLASTEGLWHKLVDNLNYSPSRGARSPSNKPFDGLWIVAKEAYVGIVFYQPRKYKHLYLIPVKDFVELKNSWKLKSIREEQLKQFPLPIIL